VVGLVIEKLEKVISDYYLKLKNESE